MIQDDIDRDHERRVSPEDVAHIYSVTRREVGRWLASGCPHERLGPRTIRLRLSEVRRWLLEREAARAAKAVMP